MKAKVEKIYPLSPMQKGMLFHAMETPAEDAYFEQTVLDINGAVDAVIFEESFNELLRRHEILRASIHTKMDEPVHIILTRRTIKFKYMDITDSADVDPTQFIAQYLKEDQRTGFNLSKDNLLRVGLVRIQEQHYKMVWTFHHMVLDGWSIGILFNELLTIYASKAQGKEPQLDEVRPYSEYMKWLQNQDKENGLSYWKDYLAGYNEKASLPAQHTRAEDLPFVRKEKRIEFSKELTNKIKKMAQRNAITLHTVIQTLWGFLLAKYNDRDDTVFGTVVSGREANVEGIEQMVGLFINTIPTRVSMNGDTSFVDLMKKIQSDALASQSYQYLSLAEVQSLSELKHDLLDHVVVFENYAFDSKSMEQKKNDLGFEIREVNGDERTNYHFTIAAGLGEKLTLLLIYNAQVHEPSIMDQIEKHMKMVMNQIASNEEIRAKDIVLVSEDERQKLGYLFHGKQTDYPREKTIPELFEEQVEKTPDAAAVVMGHIRLSYRELHEKSNRLAARLRARGIQSQAIIGLMAERSPDMIVGILGILKSGAAYLPMDPEWPSERIEHMLHDSGAALLLTQQQWMTGLPSGTEAMLLDSDEEDMAAAKLGREPETGSADDLAYIIYTSGSTGTPKGVMISHANAIRVVQETDYITIRQEDAVLQLSNYAFDGSVFDIFGALLNGARLVLIEQETVLDIAKLAEVMNRENITVAFMTTALFNVLVDREPDCLKGLRKLLFGGERGSVIHARKALASLGPDKLIHVYGPTESTVFTTYYSINEIDEDAGSLPIGKPIANTSVWIVDRNQQLVPPGVPGELCISGDGLSRGYLNNEELTATKFVPHPFESGGRMYRTGDRVRWLPDGQIEFLERMDHQVKLRGYRIELGEIEQVLLEHENIREAIVLARKDPAGQDVLYAYVTAAVELSRTEIRAYAGSRLPGYMIPAYFILLDHLPLTANGKVDRKALPEPDASAHAESGYAAPSTTLEHRVLEIWKEVLGAKSIGIHDHFFEVGGHSLKATTLASRIHKELQVAVPLRQIFLTPTIQGIAEYIHSAKEHAYSSIEKAEDKPYYALSSAQRRLHILNQIADAGTSYNMPAVMRIKGYLDIARFEHAFRQLVHRHEAFRTSFLLIDGEPVQKIEQDVPFTIGRRHLGEESLDETIQSMIRPFELDQAPLLRVEIIEMSEHDQIVVMDMHHIIADGVSTGILTQEFHALYDGKKLPPLPLQYKDYSEWQKKWFLQDAMKEQEKYWLDMFKGEIPVLQLPADWPRPKTYSFKGDRIRFNLDPQILRQLHQMARDHEATLYMLLLAGYTTLLAKYSGQEDIIVGSPIAGRVHEDLKPIIGIFVNTLAMRNFPRFNLPFTEFLKQVKENSLKAYENQNYPFDELVDKLNLHRDRSRNALIDTMFVLQNLDHPNEKLSGLQIEPYESELPIAKFDLTLIATEKDGELELELEYCSDLFSRTTIESMSGHLIRLFTEIVRQPECPLGEINLVSDEERQMLLHVFNDTAREYPRDQAVPQFIEDQAHRRPDHTAVVFEGEQLTYRELNEQADRVAQLLRARGVRRETPVGIMIDRSLEMVTGLLGILKSGGAYLPLDPAFPEERIRYMLEDSGAKLVVTQGHLVNKVGKASRDCETLVIDDSILTMQTVQEASAQTSAAANKVDHDPQDLAYIIYTSGSTGLPKGVLVEHGAFANFCQGYAKTQHITEQDRVSNYLQITFDASISEIFPALMMGATLHVIPAELRLDLSRLNAYMNEQSITLATFPCKVCEAFIGQPNESLRLLIAGGEQLKLSTLPHYPVVNAYGPTENTVVTTSQLIDRAGGNIPIGKPVPNTRIYILNRSRQLCPVGVTGELYIAGDSLARGYLNNAVQTAEKFVDNPYEPGGRMYRTGDLARWLPDGSLVFMGRADQQVKIRGYRIEPGEVEQQLLKHPAIREAVVIAHEDRQGVSSLCAYLISDDVWTTTAVRELLEAELPEYMIPAYVIQLEQLPLTSHGKLDRKSLPEPDRSLRSGPDYEAPRNEVEEKLVSVWREVLGIEDIGINHQFFVSGGDSIKALQIGSRLAKAGLRLEVKDLFAHPKIKDLSSYVKVEQRERRTEESVEGEVEYTPIQQWFFQQNREERNHFTQSFMLHRAEGFEASRIEQVFDQLLAHHDALRMIYAEQDGEIRQINRRAGERMFSLHRYDVRGMDDQERQVYEIATKIQQASAIEEGKLVQIGLFRAEDGDHLLIAIHHLVVDGVSWRILLEDFELLYRQAEQDAPLDIGFKTDSYQRFAGELKEYALGKQAEKERAYWTELAAVKTRFIPGQVVPEPDTFANSRTIQSSLREETTLQLLRESNRAYQTEINDLLLSALYVAVRELTGEQRLKVNLEGHGREDVLEGMDVSRTVGWFTTMYPVVLEGEEQDELSKTIKRIKEGLRKVPNKGIGYGVLKYLTRVPELQNEERAPVAFNYIGEMDGTMQGEGIFRESRFSSGESIGSNIVRNNPIEFNTFVMHGELIVNTTFNEAQFSESVVQHLLQTYIQSITTIVNHCVNKVETEKTPSDYGDTSLTLDELERIKTAYSDNTIERIYPLTNMQQGMIFHAMEDTNSTAYFQQTVMDIQGFVDAEALQHSFNEIMSRHEALRASFEYRHVEEPRQIIIRHRDVVFEWMDLRTMDSIQSVAAIEEYLKQDKGKGFDLSREALMRVALFHKDDSSYTLVWSHHHILLDGWCLGIILTELFQLYRAKIKGVPHQLKEPKPYRHYIEWLVDQDEEEGRAYWTRYLQGYETQAQIPGSLHATTNLPYIRNEKNVSFGRSLTKKLAELANSNGVTLNTVIQCLWGLVLARYNDTEEVVFGTVVSGREAPVEGIEETVGLFINTIPVRIRLERSKDFGEVLRKVQKETIESNQFNYMNLAEVQALSELNKELIDHVFVFENYAVNHGALHQANEDIGFQIESLRADEQSNYGFMISATPGEQLHLVITYDGNKYDNQVIDNIEQHLRWVAEQVSSGECKQLADIELVSGQEREWLLERFNEPQTEYPRSLTIHQMFEEQAQRTPEQTAIVFETQKLTYRELNERSNRLARTLKARGIGTDQFVAIMADRSLDMIVGLLAILKAGGAYVPIDPEYPDDRIRYMLEDSGASLLLLQEKRMNRGLYAGPCIVLEDESFYHHDSTNLESTTQPHHLAYVIYTSGTTGKPKGTLIEHKNVIRLLVNERNRFDFNQTDTWTMFHSFCFDFSVWEMYGALLYGGKLVVVSHAVASQPAKFLQLLIQQGVTILNQTPSYFYKLLHEEMGRSTADLAVRKVIFGGEALSPSLLKDWSLRYPSMQMINMYGITETTVHVTYKEITDADMEQGKSSIGRPLPTLRAYILNQYRHLQPVGSAGELYVAGDGLARGYLNREELTAERFVDDPFYPGVKMYKSGDLARWQSDGNMEYLGRIDHQVKIRGYRIELGEIEHQLLKQKPVKDAIVIARKDEEQSDYICAYLTFKGTEPDTVISDIRHALSLNLPDYMVPAYIMQLDQLPLTPNGKVDRKALPVPEVGVNTEYGYDAPTNNVEKHLLSIWQDILKTDKIGINHHFFEVGGHSLKAAALISRIHKEMGVEVPLRQVFITPTIKGLGQWIASAQASVYLTIPKAEDKPYYPLSSAQRRLYILNQIEDNSLAYNMPFAIRLTGSLDVPRLEQAFQKLVARHESLRTSFHMIDGQPVQKIQQWADFTIGYSELGGQNIDECYKRFIRPFDLTQAPLLRVEIVKIDEREFILVFDMHHIISDGVSMGILTKELAALYEGRELEPLELQYKDYSQWQAEYHTAAAIKQQADYWLNVFEGDIPVLELPTDYTRPQHRSYAGDLFPFELSPCLTGRLQRLGQEHGATMFMLLLAGYSTLLSRYTGQKDLVIGSPIAGNSQPELKNVIGLFINTLALRTNPTGDSTFLEYLNEVKETTLKAYENQEYPFDELVENLALTRDMSRSALFDTMLVLQNFESNEFVIDGLTFSSCNMNVALSKFDLTLTAFEEDDRIKCIFTYSTELFKRETIERMVGHLIHIFEEISENPVLKLKEISMLSAEESESLLLLSNGKRVHDPEDKTISQLFEDQVKRTPQHTAVVFGEYSLTYQELNNKSNQLARWLKAKGAVAESIVALIIKPSLDMIVSMLAVLKAGAVFLPIDPDQTTARTNVIFRDSEARILLVNRTLSEGIYFGGEVLDLRDRHLDTIDTGDLLLPNSPDNNVYMIYTSGSTGIPKGVLVRNSNLVNYTRWFIREAGLSSDDKTMLMSSYAFDLGYTGIFTSLLQGCQLHLVPKELYSDASTALKMIREQGITFVKLTPSLFNVIVNDAAFANHQSSLRLVVLGGEKINTADVETFYRRYPDSTVMNHYGPTETTIGVVYQKISRQELASFTKRPVIGMPIDNTRVYVLDSYMNLLPEGIYGELCVSGKGVSSGYFNQTQLTREKFLDDPFHPGQVMYRTGDLARRLNNGCLELAGRIDSQVKIRGYRIETEEIKRQLLQLEGIQEALIVARDNKEGSNYLCAYITSGNPVTFDELRSHLSRELPDYMIPSYFVLLDRLPLTPNGKVDLKSLPEPDISIGGEAEYEAPRNEVEAQLTAVWEEVLGFKPLGINHNFFAAGGDSIKALQIISRLSRAGMMLTMKELFANPQIKLLGKYVKNEVRVKKMQEMITGEVALTPIQKSYFMNYTSGADHFNQAVILYREDGFDQEKVSSVMKKLMYHHDALRMIYRFDRSHIVQINRDMEADLFSMDVVDVSELDEANLHIKVQDVATRLHQQINIQQGPLVKTAIFRTNQGDHLLIIIHHLIIDGVSWRIILEDFAIGYNQLLEKQELSFYPVSESYQHYASMLQTYAKSRKLQGEKDYWKAVSAEKVVFLNKIEDISEFRYGDNQFLSISLNQEETDKLLRKTNHAYNTEINDILIAALTIAVREQTGENKIKISMEGHGREHLVDNLDISRTVGWFTSKYPVLIDLGTDDDIGVNIKRVKEQLRKVPLKGIGYGILKYLTEDLNSRHEENPPLLFNYLGQMDQEMNNNQFNSSWLPAGELIGNAVIRANPMELNALVVEGQLTVNLTYNHKVYRKDTVKAFAESYIRALQMVIAHCLSRQVTEKTPSDYGDKELSLEQLEIILKKYNGWQVEKIYPLANMQRGMLFHTLEDQESRAYFEQVIIDLKGELNAQWLKESLNEVMTRHEILRASYEYDAVSEPRNVIIKNRLVEFVYQDNRYLGIEECKASVAAIAREDRSRGFDMSQDTLIRFQLIRTDDDRHTLIWSNHHILLDGWARGLILGELLHLYSSKASGREYRLEEAAPYSDYIQWMQELDKEEAKSYWSRYLEFYENKAQIPMRANSPAPTVRHKEHHIRFSKDLTQQMNRLANRNNVTFYTVLQCIWGVVLAKYNDTKDVVFGTVVSGREAPVTGIERMVGLFINTIPARINWEPQHSFKQLMKNIQNKSIESNEYHHLNLSEIQSLSSLKRDLIDHVMVFENYGADESLAQHGESNLGFVVEEVHSQEQTNYGFNLIAIPGDQLLIKLAYDAGKYEKSVILNIEKHILSVLEQVVHDDNRLIDNIELVADEERAVLLQQFNNTTVSYPKEKTIDQLFIEQAARTPELTAVILGEHTLTYRELNTKSNQLARHLRSLGVRPDTMVGIMVERSPEMIVGILGIMKAGGAYVPIDPDYPSDRIEFILQDCGAHFILEKGTGLIRNGKQSVFLNADYSTYSAEPLEPLTGPENVAYMIYTSGSTGKPKGTMIRHRGLVNYITWAECVYLQDDKLDFALYSSFAFDLTITSIFTPLISGNKIVVYPNDGDGPIVREVFLDNKAGIVKLTPSHLNLIKDMDNTQSSIKRLIVGGEDLKSDLARAVYESFGHHIEIYNEYGPTETVVGCMIHRYDPEKDDRVSVPIGRPASNVQLYVLDHNKHLLPAGMPGELYIGGDGVSKGYYQRPELTAERFVPSPFLDGVTLYRTGDLVKWLPSGNMEFLGRIDQQVKIRGYRIEPAEIEHQLLQQLSVKDAVVMALTDRTQQHYLCAYIVPRDVHSQGEMMELKQMLLKKLPEYMVPSYFVVLEQLPLTVNGKVDLKALPEPDGGNTVGEEYIPPGTVLEEQLVEVWEDILPVKPISIHANLFESGANSLNIMSFVSRMYGKLNFRIPFKNIFENPTIAGLAAFIEKAKDLLEDYTEDCIQLTRSSRSNKNIFCFPPAASMGIAYMALAQHLELYSVYTFNFIKSEDRIEQYAKIMTDIQKDGPFILLGYSSGGILAFDVAKELNRQGYEVSDLIILDSRYRTTVDENRLTEEQFRQELYKKFDLEQYNDLEKLARDYLMELITKSYKYVHEAITFGSIDGNISYITSGDAGSNAQKALWKNATTQQFKIIRGHGSHMQMIAKAYPDIVKENAMLINDLLASIKL
ncbi:non-ribosomal peptide synthetase [Paenibacillus durus]|uniref:Phenylalanine racemase n=1 Tax=Paenibacillus durus TaxID=44251 RepID=A0A089HQ11_PAEDU|nr:non-ribosomal peptide synthetase [Paenibacillus durus]AIQ12433.1 phenylalanine racemase [Paenibacillus durus]